MVRYQGHSVLIDCGEGTQIAAQHAGLALKSVDKILLTHLHADHVSGLPGFLLSLGNQGRTEPLSIIGPVGTERVVHHLCVIAPHLPFEIRVSELETEEELMYFLDCDIHAFQVDHGVPCYGYSFTLPRSGKFDAVRAQNLGVPLLLWSRLQKGESIEVEGRTITPSEVLGPPRRGVKLTYCTDTRPIPEIARAASGSDLFICEGMYGDEAFLPRTLENRHMMFAEAAQLAVEAGDVQELWLTHFSPSLPNPWDYRKVACAIFPNTQIPRDGWTKTLRFRD